MLISYSSTDNSLATAINAIIAKKTCESHEDTWRLFLQDHRALLIENSNRVEISQATLRQYKYRIKDYLESLNLNSGLSQAVCIANRFPSDMYFNTDVTAIYIPSHSYVQELKRKYTTIQSKIAKL